MKTKMTIIGPVHPFKGGIAHHNTLLINELLKRNDLDLQIISFKRIFPKWVYFRTQRKNVKDEQSENFLKGKAIFSLDMVNPLTWLKTARLVKLFKPDVVLFHWYTPILAIPMWIFLSLIKRGSAPKIIAMCHNVLPHEKMFLDKQMTGLVFGKSDLCLVQSESDEKILKNWLPQKKSLRIFHPMYDFFHRPISENDARKELGIPGSNILFFGGIRTYKGLMYLIDALPEVRKKFDVTLVIAGEFFHDKKPYLDRIKELGIQNSVKIMDHYIPNEKVALLFSATDALITPYIYGPQSGVAAIAYSFLKPVIGTENLREIIIPGKTGYLARAKDSADLARAIIKLYEEKDKIDFKKNISELKDKLSWKSLCDIIIKNIQEAKW